MESSIGIIEIQSYEGKIISLDFVKERKYDETLEPVLEEAKKQLRDYFDGKRKAFDLPLKINGTEFQNKVWVELTKIPYGETQSYKDIAIWIGNKNASRAIGNANNKNKIAIIIPCHRVVGSNGKLIGYEGGLWRKKWLLEHEERHF
nr:methylated-DNA--[protein]-cysteine S-methyltransferase [Anaeromonas frigoriresistens]